MCRGIVARDRAIAGGGKDLARRADDYRADRHLAALTGRARAGERRTHVLEIGGRAKATRN
jgi:hypothetical protein